MIQEDDDPRALVKCPHCVSRVQGCRLSLHINRVHKNVEGKQQCVLNADHKVDDLSHHLEEECDAMIELQKNAYDGGGISTVPAPPPCNINFDNVENWETTDYPSYDPLENTKNKNIIRGSYAAGLQPAQRKLVIVEERVRRAELTERESAERLNRISTRHLQSITKSDLPSGGNTKGYSTLNVQSTIPMQGLQSSNDPTTDSDGYTCVNYNKRSNAKSRGRGRGRL